MVKAFPGSYHIQVGVMDHLSCICSPNFLILDEPTNHLDVETVEALGKALTQFNVSLCQCTCVADIEGSQFEMFIYGMLSSCRGA